MGATKQQIEQGKARAGGNNPVKVTKAGVKRLGQAALIAASFTPIGRTAKIAGIIAKPISKVVQARGVKNTKVVVEKIAKMQEKAKAERIASNSVKLKPAAKQIPNNPSYTKAVAQGRASGGRAYNKAAKEYEEGAGKYGNMYEMQDAARTAMFESPIGRKTSIALKKIADADALKATTPRTKDATFSTKPSIKINSAPKQTTTKTEVKANARGLKAANKPLSKGNKKLVTQVKQQTGYIAMDRRPTPPTVAAALKKGPKGSFIAEAKKIAMQEARSMGPAKKISPAQKMLNDKATALRAETNKALARSARGKTQTPTAEAARRRNLNK